MSKKVVYLLGLLAMVAVLLYGCGRYDGAPNIEDEVNNSIETEGEENTETEGGESTETVVEGSTNDLPIISLPMPDKEYIIQEVTADLDCDGFEEHIILDSSPDEYIRLLVFRDEDCIFNSSDHGIAIQKDFFGNEEPVSISDENKNGMPEVHFVVNGDGIQPDDLAMIENYEVLFYQPLTNYGFEDLNADGDLELCGCSNWGGEVMFNSAEYSAFQFNKGQYEYAQDLTHMYYQKLCSIAEEEFEYEQSYDNLEYLISLYARTGDREKGELLINQYIELLNGGNSQYDEDFFMVSFDMRLAENGF